jgi:2,3-dihydroxy-p-cumate/2,3-dihydroxybenzoate 3,4-dioxygenase
MFRYAKLGYVALNVSDVARSAEFYGPEIVGMQSSGGTDTEHFLRCSDGHHDLILCKAKQPGLKRIGWQMESDEHLASIRARIAAAGVKIIDVPAEEQASLHQGQSFRISEPFTGATYEYYSVMANQAGVGFRRTVANIQRLGHVLSKTPDYDRAVEFHENVLNFKASDIIEGFGRFYRCWPNPYHHTFGLVRAAERGFSHINFMVTDVDDIGRAIGRFTRKGIKIAWGPGRHPASNSVFLYFLDPDGMTAEYSYGMEEFPETDARAPRTIVALPENIDFWDAPRYAETANVGDIEQLQL